MGTTIKEVLWLQYGAAIDMLENGIVECPEKLWGDRSQKPEFWYIAYHTIFFLDFYLSDSAEGFTPPQPFGLTELDPAGVFPERVYSQDELLTYLKFARNKCKEKVSTLSDENAELPCAMRKGLTVAELYMYTMRHVQHHAAQLYLILRQQIDSAPPWVSKAKD